MRKVSAGQPLRIPASTYNAMIDATVDHQRRTQNLNVSALPLNTRNGLVLVRNQTGTDRNRFDVVGLSNVVVTPSENAQEFAARWAFNAVQVADTHVGKFAVLQEPVKSGAFALALVVGVTPVFVARPSGENSETAGIKASQLHLETGLNGAQILWEDSGGVTPHLALVRMPGQGESQSILRMRVSGVQNNHLVCQRWNGTAFSATTENVAKPYLLRTSITSRNGITYSYSSAFARTATQGASTESQVIVPSFVIGTDEIFVAQVASTGVSVSGTELKLIDINADGRAWAKQ